MSYFSNNAFDVFMRVSPQVKMLFVQSTSIGVVEVGLPSESLQLSVAID